MWSATCLGLDGVTTVRTRLPGTVGPSTSASARRRFRASLVVREGVGVCGVLGRLAGGAPRPIAAVVCLAAARLRLFFVRSAALVRPGGPAATAVGCRRGSGGKGSSSLFKFGSSPVAGGASAGVVPAGLVPFVPACGVPCSAAFPRISSVLSVVVTDAPCGCAGPSACDPPKGELGRDAI